MRLSSIPRGRKLRIEVKAPATVRWTDDDWATLTDVSTRDTTLGLHVADLPTDKLAAGTVVAFTFFWTTQNRWENRNFQVQIRE